MRKRNGFRRAFFRFWAPLLALLLPGGVLAEAPAPFPLDQVRPGLKGQVLTVLEGTEPVSIEVELLGVLEDWIAPGVPLVLGRFTGETGRFKGVAAGMSGSPVMVEGKLLGALSYSIGSFTKEPICGITPIGQMLELRNLPESPLPWRPPGAVSTLGAGLRPIPLSLSVSGLDQASLADFSDIWDGVGLAAQAGAGGAPVDSLDGDDLQPGRPITAMLLWGDKQVGATGTITWREGDRLLAFGHPFLGFGRISAPLTPAEIVWTVPSTLDSFKIARYGPPVGTMTEDRLTAIAGRVGPVPVGIPIHVRVVRPDAPVLERSFHALRSPLLTATLVNFALRSAVSDAAAAEQDEALHLTGAVKLEGTAPVPLDIGGPGGRDGPPVRQLGTGLVQVISALMRAPVDLPPIESIDLEVKALPRRGALKVIRALPDRLVVPPGGTVTVAVDLIGSRGDRHQESLRLQVPMRALSGKYLLVAGSTRALEGETGSVAEARRRTARSGEEYLAALREDRSTRRLEVRLLLKAEGIVSRGKAYPALPGTAHILLRSGPEEGELYRSRWIEISSARAELERSLVGVAKSTITVISEESKR